MQRILSFLVLIFFLFSGLIFSQSSGNDSPNRIQVAFPFFDDVENNSTSSSYWQRDTTIWKIQITNAHSGSQVWAMLPSSGSYNYLTLASNIDLSSTANPYLSFWVK
ncbi:MAG: hypothetical protein ABI638_07865, partial [Ignavibacteriota bacterium]